MNLPATLLQDRKGQFTSLFFLKKLSQLLGLSFTERFRTFFGVKILELQSESYQHPLNTLCDTWRDYDSAHLTISSYFDGFDVFGQMKHSIPSSSLSLNFDHDKSSILVYSININKARLNLLLIAYHL